MTENIAQSAEESTAVEILNFNGAGPNVVLLDQTIDVFYAAGSKEEVRMNMWRGQLVDHSD